MTVKKALGTSKEMGYVGMDWICVSQDRDQALNLRMP